MKKLKLRYVLASLMGMALLSTGAYADPGQMGGMDSRQLELKVATDLTHAAMNGMQRKTRIARENLASAEAGLKVLKERGYKPEVIAEHEDSIKEIKEILG